VAYRDVEELLAERGVDVVPLGPAIHPAVHRRRPALPAPAGESWFVDKPYVDPVFRVPSGLEVDGVVISGRKLVVACRVEVRSGYLPEAQ
jgi:hypothetical protein